MAPQNERRRVGEVINRRLLPVLAGLSTLICAGVLYVTKYRSFFYDEWTFIVQRRGWEPEVFLFSHNGHWSTIPILVWKILFVTVGLRSHIPYEATLLIAHLVAVMLLFSLIRRRSGDLPAFAAALTLLVLGSGGDDIVWAFQLGWVASVVFGLLAMLLLHSEPSRARLIAASVSLLFSLMCSSVGLAFATAVGADLLANPARRQLLVTLVVPLLAFVVWFVIFDTGRFPSQPGIAGGFLQGAKGFGFVVSLASFVISGLQASASGVFGIGYARSLAPSEPPLGTVALIVVIAAVAWRSFRQRRFASWQVGMAAGLLVWFPLIGLGRAQLGANVATSTRYVYVGVVFLLPLVADAAAGLPWQGLWRPALTVAFALLLLGNITQLADVSLSLGDFMQYQSAELQTVEVFRGAPDMARNRYIDDSMEPRLLAKDYLAAITELGSPVPRATVDSLRRLPWFAVDRVMLNLFGDALSVKPDASRSLQGLECRAVAPLDGSPVNLQVANGQPLMVQSANDASATLYLSLLGPPGLQPTKQAQLAAATPEWVHLPDTGKPIVWQLQIRTRPVGTLRICNVPGFHATQPGTFGMAGATFTLGAGWEPVGDATATGGKALKAARGTPGPEGAYSAEFTPTPGAYDIWYRVRVASSAGDRMEMTLTLTDATANRYVAAMTFTPSDVQTTYSWLLVGSNITPPSGDVLRFQTNIAAKLSTDWYVDAAIMQPQGSPAPQIG